MNPPTAMYWSAHIMPGRFELDGSLRGRPNYHGPGQHDHGDVEDTCLFGVRSAPWHDWFFVNLDGNAGDFADYIGPIDKCYADWQLGSFVLAHQTSFKFNCNWKLAVENFCDNYHVFKVHPGLHDMQHPEDRFGMQPEGHHMVNWFTLGSPGRGLTIDPDGPTLPLPPQLPASLNDKSPFCNLFPNAAMAIFPSNITFVTYEPNGAHHCTMNQWFYFVGDAAHQGQYREAREKVYAEWLNLNAEDEGVCQRIQQGRNCDQYDGGRLSPYWDLGTIHFHRQVAAAVRGEGAFARD